MTLRATGGLLSRFAHLTGGVSAKAKAEDEEDKKKPGETTDGKKSGDDDDDVTAGEGGEDTDGDGNDDEEGDKKEGKRARAAARAERARCAAIFSHPAAASNTALAAELAFNTNLSADAAAALLASVPVASARPGLMTLMSTVPAITIGADPAGSDGAKSKGDEAQTLAKSIVGSARAAGIIRK